jgi:hypothetical protein
MIDRTTLVLPLDLKNRAVARARNEGISFAELVRRALEAELASQPKFAAGRQAGDLFLDHLKTFKDDGPTDWSTRVDELLYGALGDEFQRRVPQ